MAPQFLFSSVLKLWLIDTLRRDLNLQHISVSAEAGVKLPRLR